jgi:transposase-like protein
MEFMREFPDDEACLTWLWRSRCSTDGEHAFCERCQKERSFKRYGTSDKRPAWFCSACGFRIHPLKGTIFEKSSTSLHLWFYAMWLMTSTRCGISAKQLERELGVTYKTAWRMFNLIRNKLMEQDSEPLSGEVEVDETFIGGKLRNADRRKAAVERPGERPYTWKTRAVVYGAVERKGRVRASVIPNSRRETLLPITREYVMPESLIYTDEWSPYSGLTRLGYYHRRIRHKASVYVEGDTHTQTIDGFFGLFKNAVRGVHHGVSHKWLQGYLNEYVWRWNRRGDGNRMFYDLLEAASDA